MIYIVQTTSKHIMWETVYKMFSVIPIDFYSSLIIYYGLLFLYFIGHINMITRMCSFTTGIIIKIKMFDLISILLIDIKYFYFKFKKVVKGHSA